MDNFKPVKMCGKENGIIIFEMYFQAEKPNALLTFLWSLGIDATPKAVLIIMGQMQQIKIINTLAFGEF
jgi:hypothetical protein